MQSSSFEIVSRQELVRVPLYAESLLVSKNENEIRGQQQTPVIHLADIRKREPVAAALPVCQMLPEPVAYMKLNKYDFF